MCEAGAECCHVKLQGHFGCNSAIIICVLYLVRYTEFLLVLSITFIFSILF